MGSGLVRRNNSDIIIYGYGVILFHRRGFALGGSLFIRAGMIFTRLMRRRRGTRLIRPSTIGWRRIRVRLPLLG